MHLKVISILILFLFLLSIPFSGTLADFQEGVMLEFRKEEERSLAKKSGLIYQQKVFEQNLFDAVKYLILRRLYYDKDKYLKDLSIKNIAYENPNSLLVYFIKYKDFVARLEFELNPRMHRQQTKHVKLILIDKSNRFENSQNGK